MQGRRWPYLLLALPMVATLAVPLYNRAGPAVAGIPFFYWYLLAWVPLSALCNLAAYVLLERRR